MSEGNYDERWTAARDLACKINLWPTVENLQQLDAALRRAKAEGMRWAEQIVETELVTDRDNAQLESLRQRFNVLAEELEPRPVPHD